MKFIDFLIKNNIHELILFIIIGLTIYIIIKKSLSTNQEKINRKQQTIKKLIINISKYTIIIFLILKLLTILGINVRAIIAGLGVVSVVIGLALQDIMKDVLSGIFIIIENQYDVGDEVMVPDVDGIHIGVVMHIQWTNVGGTYYTVEYLQYNQKYYKNMVYLSSFPLILILNT